MEKKAYMFEDFLSEVPSDYKIFVTETHESLLANGYRIRVESLDALPENMNGEVSKSAVCKRLIDPGDCNAKCVMGYDFSIRGDRYKKCRYGCFQFEVNAGSVPVLAGFIDKERRERQSDS